MFDPKDKSSIWAAWPERMGKIAKWERPNWPLSQYYNKSNPNNMVKRIDVFKSLAKHEPSFISNINYHPVQLWVLSPSLPVISRLTLDKLLNLFEFWFPLKKIWHLYLLLLTGIKWDLRWSAFRVHWSSYALSVSWPGILIFQKSFVHLMCSLGSIWFSALPWSSCPDIKWVRNKKMANISVVCYASLFLSTLKFIHTWHPPKFPFGSLMTWGVQCRRKG